MDSIPPTPVGDRVRVKANITILVKFLRVETTHMPDMLKILCHMFIVYRSNINVLNDY